MMVTIDTLIISSLAAFMLGMGVTILYGLCAAKMHENEEEIIKNN